VTRGVDAALRSLRAEGVEAAIWKLVLAQSADGDGRSSDEAAALLGCDDGRSSDEAAALLGCDDVLAALVEALVNELKVLVITYGVEVFLCVDAPRDSDYKKVSKKRAKYAVRSPPTRVAMPLWSGCRVMPCVWLRGVCWRACPVPCTGTAIRSWAR
jgi:hypothetical protein